MEEKVKNEKSGRETDWVKVQGWLQDAAMELEYLALRVSATRNGKMPEGVPSVFALANDMAEPLTEAGLKNRIKEISRLSETWATSDTFPQF